MMSLLNCFKSSEENLNIEYPVNFSNCCTNNLSTKIMQTKGLSLKTFAIMAIHENVNMWSQKLNLSPYDFILNLFLPQHLITTLYVHFVCCDLHNENHLFKHLHLKCCIDPDVHIKEPLFMKLNYSDNNLVCLQDTFSLSHSHELSVGTLLFIVPY